MRKKMLLIFCLCFVFLSAEGLTPSSNNFEIGKWKEFIGVNIGAGLYDIEPGYIFHSIIAWEDTLPQGLLVEI